MAGGLPHPVLLSTFMGMDEITLGGQVIEFKHVFYSWVCMAILFTVAFIMRRRLTLVPGGLQNFFEALIDTIERFVCSTASLTAADTGILSINRSWQTPSLRISRRFGSSFAAGTLE